MSKEADMFRRPSVLIETPAKCITHTDVLPCPLVSNHIRWQDKIPDLEFVERARIPSIHTLPKKPHVRWQCHVTRMPDSPLPKQLLYRALSWWAEVLSWGTEKICFKDCTKRPSKTWTSTPVVGSHLPRIVQLGAAKSPLGPMRPNTNRPLNHRGNVPHTKAEQPPPPLQHPHTHVLCVGEPSRVSLVSLAI